jgi:hypothetical protein
VGNHEEYCVPKKIVKATELEECNKEENTWTEVKHHFEKPAKQQERHYSQMNLEYSSHKSLKKESLLKHFF